MPQTPNPPELVLLKALWMSGPMPVRALHEHCADELGWSFSSTRKTISRMYDKGFVAQSASAGPLRVRARVSKTVTLAHMTRDFMGRVLEIEGPVPDRLFSASKILSDEELEELSGLL